MGTRSFGIQWGALNWVDWHDGHWWMTFANYDLPIGPNKTPYGHKANTLMVKLTRDFRPAELWTFPKMLLDKFELMSNSGGSWGADGFLYLTPMIRPNSTERDYRRPGPSSSSSIRSR